MYGRKHVGTKRVCEHDTLLFCTRYYILCITSADANPQLKTPRGASYEITHPFGALCATRGIGLRV